MHCPLCQAELPDGAADCSRCDWVRDPALPPTREPDWIAAALSIVPGLGHLYKGHLIPGVLILCLIGPAYLAIVFLLLPATLGLSLILPAIFVGFVAVHAFRIRDVRTNPGALEYARRTVARWGGGPASPEYKTIGKPPHVR